MFATAEDLATYLAQGDIDTARAELLLTQATAKMKRYVGQDIEQAQTTIELRLKAGSVYLPQRPVVSVDTVRFRNFTGTFTNAQAFIFDGIDRVYGWDSSYILNLPEPWWDEGYQPVIVEVTYTHGFAVVPEDLQAIAVGLAARSFALSGGGAYQQERVGEYEYRVNEAFVGVFLPDEKIVMDAYRRTARTVSQR